MAAGRRPGVLSAAQVAQLLEREFSQAFHRDSGTTIEDAWHGGCRIRRAYSERMLRPGGTAVIVFCIIAAMGIDMLRKVHIPSPEQRFDR